MRHKGSAKVFVDDYATGRLPGVCVVTGEPTADQVRLRTNVSTTSAVWWLLVLLGPIGWLVLLAVINSSRSYVEGWLPYSHAEARRRRAMWRSSLIWFGATIVGLLLLSAGLNSGLLGGVAVVVLVAGLVTLAIRQRGEPLVSLDASGRWVTFNRVHPAFVTAVEEQYVPKS